ncbi:hypothetical protein ACGFII_31270 [Micromonospora chalcea]
MVNAAAQHHVEAVRSITGRHLDRYLELLNGIVARAGAADPDVLGRQLLMLVEGATIIAEHRGAASTDGHARRAALTLWAPPISDVSARSSGESQT